MDIEMLKGVGGTSERTTDIMQIFNLRNNIIFIDNVYISMSISSSSSSSRVELLN